MKARPCSFGIGIVDEILVDAADNHLRTHHDMCMHRNQSFPQLGLTLHRELLAHIRISN